MKRIGKIFKRFCQFALFVFVLLGVKTVHDFQSPYKDFHSITSDVDSLQILDREGKPLSFSYQNRWNIHDNVALHQVPEILQQAFILSEDRRFFEHCGVDWLARGSAFWQRVKRSNFSRGASTITEQVVRMLHPHRRSYWAKWIEGLEAIALETKVNKADILEFYLNQVPYANNRRGLVQASRFYFNRDIKTLNTKEMLALVVLVRAPSKFDLYAAKVQIDDSVKRLAEALRDAKVLDEEAVANLDKYDLELDSTKLAIEASHFVDYVRQNAANNALRDQSKVLTTLDGNLQIFTKELLESRLQALSTKNIKNAAALVVNHKTHEILAWVAVGSNCKKSADDASGCKIDMVRVPRQPGSALKPFLYAAALEKGWTAATVIDDSPYSESVGKGIHHFHNYSNSYYGKVSLRTALGNSLNIPALHAAAYVTPEKYLSVLHNLGFESLTQPADFYGDGLALGNGEVSLFELVQGYTTLANLGEFEPLKITFEQNSLSKKKQIYSQEVASLIGNILSDPWARNLEFGRGSVLNLPTQTAVKTGTSTDYRDAWAVGYNHEFVVGIWMGNVGYEPTDGVTGSLGPSLALRAIFNELTKNSKTEPLFLSSKLVAKDICVNPQEVTNCTTYTEYFLPQTTEKQVREIKLPAKKIEIFRPTDGLEIALDPRIPSDKQAFEMSVSAILESDEVDWKIDQEPVQHFVGPKFLWVIKKGKHNVKAVVWRDGKILAQTEARSFNVK